MKKIFLLILVILMPNVMAIDAIVDSYFMVKYTVIDTNSSDFMAHLNITVEKDETSTKTFSWELNDNTNFEERKDFTFISNIEDPNQDYTKFRDLLLNYTTACEDEREILKQLKSNETCSGLIDEFQFINESVNNHLKSCESAKTSCINSKSNLYTKEQIEEAKKGKGVNYILSVISGAAVMYFITPRVGSRGGSGKKRINPKFGKPGERREVSFPD